MTKKKYGAVMRVLKMVSIFVAGLFLLLIIAGVLGQRYLMYIYRLPKTGVQVVQFHALADMICTHKNLCHEFPTSDETLRALKFRPCDAKGLDEGLFKKFHNYSSTDVWQNPVHFVGGDKAALMSYGSDGKPGGAGDAADITVPIECP